MVAITIRNVDPAVRDELARRAQCAGQSLQEFLRALLAENAAQRPLSEIIAEAQANLERFPSKVTTEETVRMIREYRDHGRG